MSIQKRGIHSFAHFSIPRELKRTDYATYSSRMVQSDAVSVEDYLSALPPERRRMVEAIRAVVLKHLPSGYKEGMQYGMITYFIPLETFPKTYNKLPLALASLASQKNYVSFYLNNIYSEPAILRWFLEAYKTTGMKPDIGKSCIRFKRLDDIPLKLLGEAIARTPVAEFIKMYERAKPPVAAKK
jgi:hypothetical protein